MRTRDISVSSDFSELNQLFLHLRTDERSSGGWWRSQVLRWCRTSATTEHGDLRAYVVSFIDRILALGWSDERLARLLEQYALIVCRLPTKVTIAEFLAEIESTVRADLMVFPVGAPRIRHTAQPTKLHTLLIDKSIWDDSTWFQVERYLVDNLNLPGMLLFVELAGCTRTGAARYFKTDAVKLLRDLPPRDVLRAWDAWRGRV